MSQKKPHPFSQTANAETLLRCFFESKIVIHLLLDKDFRIITFNRLFKGSILTLFGRIPVPGDDVRQYVQKQNLAAFEEDYLQALSGEQRERKFCLDLLAGQVYWACYLEPAFDPSGAIIGVACNSTEITEKVKQDQLLTLQKESLREVARFQSHELRRPVTSILGLTDYIAEKYGSECPEEIRLLRLCALELDQKIKQIIQSADG